MLFVGEGAGLTCPGICWCLQLQVQLLFLVVDDHISAPQVQEFKRFLGCGVGILEMHRWRFWAAVILYFIILVLFSDFGY